VWFHSTHLQPERHTYLQIQKAGLQKVPVSMDKSLLRPHLMVNLHLGCKKDIDEIISRNLDADRSQTAVKILNTILLPAMKEVGDKFGSGELILPFVLQSAEVMKRAVAHLENYLEQHEGVSKGKLVLATVYGDVHDIGKNLVKTILSNNGYQVVRCAFLFRRNLSESKFDKFVTIDRIFSIRGLSL